MRCDPLCVFLTVDVVDGLRARVQFRFHCTYSGENIATKDLCRFGINVSDIFYSLHACKGCKKMDPVWLACEK